MPGNSPRRGLLIALAIVVLGGIILLGAALLRQALTTAGGSAVATAPVPTSTTPPLAPTATAPPAPPTATAAQPTATAVAIAPTPTATLSPPVPTATALLPPPTVTPPSGPTAQAPTSTAPPTVPTATPPPPVLTVSAVPPAPPSPTLASLPQQQQIDAYISTLTPTQQIGQLLMLPVYADVYTTSYTVYLQQDQIANAIIFTEYNGGPVKPPTLAGLRQLVQALVAHAPNPLIIATDEEGGEVDRLAPYYGASPAPSALGATGDPQKAYAQAQLDAGRLKDAGINVDFAPLADVYQGGAIDRSRMFGTTPKQVTQFAGAFLDGLQQHGVMGTLKHWPGIGAAAANPDLSLPTITKTKAQLAATDFVTFQDLLAHDPGMIMVTHVMEPAYDTQYPASLSPTLVDGVLRGQLGYQGVLVSDAMAAGAIGQFMRTLGYTDPAQAVGEASVLAILAGEDIIECPDDAGQIAATVTALTQAVQSGRISPARLRLSLERIIALKVRTGLITLPP